MNVYELISFIAYFVLVLAVGVYFFFKGKGKSGEKEYFLGDRQMSGLIAAFSAGASDMSAWVLMGLPGAIFLYGLGQVWISVGLLIGTICAWLFVAPKLRRFAIKANDSITIPEFLSNRFKAKSPVLRISCAVIFVIAYCVYTASSLAACGDLFNMVLGIDKELAMIIAAAIICVYTLLGGFKAVCWTDFFQGMIMLAAIMLVPIVALFMLNGSGPLGAVVTPDNYYNLLSSGKFDWPSIANIITGLGWGLGYFGMPHILVRYMSIKSEKEMKKSQIIGIVWIAIILGMSTIVGLLGHSFLGSSLASEDKNLVFVKMVRSIFGYGAVALIGGLLLSAIVAAAMSTADSQLLASSSAFSSDIYKTAIRKNASDKEILWVGRITVGAIVVIALLIALFVSSDIMGLVSAAWSIFGAAFGPVILLSLFWKRFNYKGAVVSIIVGFVVSVLWMVLFNFEYYNFTSVIYNTGLYEIVPGFVLGLISAVAVSLFTKAPSKEIQDLYDSVKKVPDEEQAKA
ncbi:MAG: sodium/proline symporter [Clostridia bacterium]|nr:sodium/proline symporter [Clostridia bacterium]